VELVKIFLRKKKPNNTMSTSKHCLWWYALFVK
jgi:hypothetical protein